MITFSDPNNKYNIIFSIVNDDDECQFIFTNNIVRKSITYNSFIPDYTAEFLKSFLSENFSNQVKFTWHYNGGGMHQINITGTDNNITIKTMYEDDDRFGTNSDGSINYDSAYQEWNIVTIAITIQELNNIFKSILDYINNNFQLGKVYIPPLQTSSTYNRYMSNPSSN